MALMSCCHMISLTAINASTAAKWLPVNALFVLYVVTGTFRHVILLMFIVCNPSVQRAALVSADGDDL